MCSHITSLLDVYNEENVNKGNFASLLAIFMRVI